MPRAVMVVTFLLAMSLTELRAEQERGLLDPRVLTGEPAQQCCRVCKKGKPCGNGCISQERQCTKERGCACGGSGSS